MNEESMVMPVAPAYGSSGGGFGFDGNNGWWILLLLLFAGGGWGFGGGYGMGNMLGMDGMMLYPWLNQSQQISDGFRDQTLTSSVSNIQNSLISGFGDVQNALCSGFAGVNAGISNGFAQAEIADNARQIANMQTAFAGQTAMNQGFNGIASQLAQCCCDNRLAVAQTQALVQSENCADRQAFSDGIRDLLVNQTANTQKILDTMCQDKIDAKNEKIADLERQLTMANLASSQNLQTQQILAGQENAVNAVERYLAPVPIPAYIVQNPNCCGNYGTCACGM